MFVIYLFKKLVLGIQRKLPGREGNKTIKGPIMKIKTIYKTQGRFVLSCA